MYFVYVLKSEIENRLYKGMTNDIDRRVYEHNHGKNKSTKPYRPWKLVYKEEFSTFEEARKRELFFKSGFGREQLKKILDS
ncbi:MAG: GIY-YIG nuclease family protein [Lentimicrobiaceae bacterium]|jgi:putative endonuclease|nr:GIY-YIG nuclease family protein [Lentimicrobiaceae bacterium]MBT3453940.1 GIY-YIG nuclease family protein [Lentimicrobiaceae bacterium]MBT3818551.1 GIY-YIG nuclease family protein [Lentimicrobiaceae bacterium]MBT4061953.1 GIY-YIG nuclease family protein [Lentimicrobiaceae bacterium]MBT4191120.1 GIY-YIG nuclease family protein [Lentimicrobiaceae bacterium]